MPHVHLTSWQAALLVVSVGLAGGWFLMLWLVSTASRQRHVRAQPETGDLGPESPAVAGMLCHGGRVGDEVAAATLLDLAARHVVDLEEVDPQLSLCRIRQPGGAGLAPYERRILSYLDALAARECGDRPVGGDPESREALAGAAKLGLLGALFKYIVIAVLALKKALIVVIVAIVAGVKKLWGKATGNASTPDHLLPPRVDPPPPPAA